MSLFERVQETVATTLDLPSEDVGAETSMENTAAWESMAHMQLMLSVEQTFDVQIDVDDLGRLTSVSAIVAHLREMGVA